MITVQYINKSGMLDRLREVEYCIVPSVSGTMADKDYWDERARTTAEDALNTFFEGEEEHDDRIRELLKTYVYEQFKFKNTFGFILRLGKGILKEIEELEEAAIAVDTPSVKKDDFRNELLNYIEDWVEEAKEKDTRDTRGSTTGRKPKSSREIARGIYYILNPVNPTADTKAAAKELLNSQKDTGLGKFLEEQGFGGDKKEGESMSEMMQRLMMFKSADLSAFEEGDLDYFLKVVRTTWLQMLRGNVLKTIQERLRIKIKKIYTGI